MSDKPVVLIVDDIPSNIKVLANCLKDHYQIKVATGGVDCLTLAVSDPAPDLILLDIEMPDLGGHEVCKQLKSQLHTRDIPVIFVTARDDEGNEQLGLQLGAVDYITKPVRPLTVLARVNTHITLKQQRDMLQEMALKDQLTGLYNRYYLLEAAEQRMANAARHGTPISILMLDIDYFKNINDQHGHLVGDSVLARMANELLSACRKEDIVARYGGEEFAFLLGYCAIDVAEAKAEVIRQQVENLSFSNGIKVTVSIGVTHLRAEDKTIEQLFDRADKALYQAKELGRNQVCVN
jgi:diguanylate cyclase (GGDEF)-like protein